MHVSEGYPLARQQLVEPANVIKWQRSMMLLQAGGFLFFAPILCLASNPAELFVARNCTPCHNTKLKSGGLDLTAAGTIQDHRDQWETILRKLQSGEMPPKGVPRPNEQDVQRVKSWIAAEIDRADRLAAPDPGHIVARRLNRAEYNNTVRDLLGIDFQPAADFPQDDSGYGFDNIASVLSISPLLTGKYLAAAENIAQLAVFGPRVMPSTARYQPPNRRRLEKNSEKELLVAPLKTPPPYTLQDYDITGLGQPSAIHITHRFPAEGDYVFKVGVGHNRPPGWDPVPLAIWVDGKIAASTDVSPDERNVVLTGDRQAVEEIRAHVPGGAHWIAATFLRQFEGVPVSFGAKNPTTRPTPPPLSVNLGQRAPPPDTPDGIKVDWMEITGPFQMARPSEAGRRLIFTCGHLDGSHNAACPRIIVTALTRRAFRRPPTAAEIDRYVALIAKARGRGRTFDAASALAVQAVLVSPSFLFRIEHDSTAGAHAVDEYELASRLSYFLWSSPPDEDLMRAADQGTLRKPGVLAAQVHRMVQDRKADSFIENFAGQWLETRRLESVKPDRERFPDFDDYLRRSMRMETELFFGYVLRENRSVLDFLNAKFSFINERLGRHYGIASVRGPEFRKIDLTGTPRRGVFTQAGVLTVSSYPNRTSPVLRGKWILDNLLNAPPPPPPPDVPALDETAVGSSASLRKQLEQHRANGVCASCHSKMDPLGFALENYDAVGAWRTQDGNFAIDPSGVLPDNRAFRGAEQLADVLSQSPGTFAEALTQKLMTYALGRGLESSDRQATKAIVRNAATYDYRFVDLIMGIVNSVQFQERKGEVQHVDHW